MILDIEVNPKKKKISHNACVCVCIGVRVSSLFCFILFVNFFFFLFGQHYATQTIEFYSKLMGKIEPVNGTMTQPSENRTHTITKPPENAAKKCNFGPIFYVICKEI